MRHHGPLAALGARAQAKAFKLATAVAVAIALGCVRPALGARPYRGGVVATAHPSSSEAALAMLNRGGNAADAAIAAAFTLAVVDPTHSGLGGGGFALVHEISSGQTRALDFREVAPARASANMYIREGRFLPVLVTDGALAVAVPGAVAGYFEVLSKLGTLKPEVVLAPAIRAARNGFRVTPMYQRLARLRLECLRAHPEAARIFLRPNSEAAPDVPAIGTLIRQPELAKTLELLARKGARAFYMGKLAQAIESTLSAGGGILTADDLAKYRVISREPLAGSYRGHRILTMPPPSAGGLAVIQVLAIMEIKEPAAIPYNDPTAIHFYVEALRRVFVDRAKYLGDPAFVEIPLAMLTSPEHLHQLADSIDPNRATPSSALLAPGSHAESAGRTEAKHTTHLSVIDRLGNAVALTTTLNDGFGSCVVARGTGILLNDQMDDFAASPGTPNLYGLVTGEANAVAPGKRPLSSMAPTLVFQKENPRRVMIAAGAAGGPTIITSVIHVISNVIDYGMDLTRAVGQGRIHHQFLPDEIRLEPYSLDPATVKALEEKGHRIERPTISRDAQAVMEDPSTGLRYSASDPRNEGAALGQE